MGQVLCFEGALAVGKTTTALALAQRRGVEVIPEMNRLFRDENPDAPDRRSFGEYVAAQPHGWYLERQVERWERAQAAADRDGLGLLDRDPFQPLWYRWAFAYEGMGQTPEELRAFYRPLLAAGRLRFPDLYVFLSAPLAVLIQRKESDLTRDRRGFERQRRFFEPQKRYFAAMSNIAPERVLILEAKSVGDNIAAIEARLQEPMVAALDEPTLFDTLTHWLATHAVE